MERQVHGGKIAPHSKFLAHVRLSISTLTADVCTEGSPGGATEPKEPPFPCFWDLALEDKSE